MHLGFIARLSEVRDAGGDTGDPGVRSAPSRVGRRRRTCASRPLRRASPAPLHSRLGLGARGRPGSDADIGYRVERRFESEHEVDKRRLRVVEAARRGLSQGLNPLSSRTERHRHTDIRGILFLFCVACTVLRRSTLLSFSVGFHIPASSSPVARPAGRSVRKVRNVKCGAKGP